MKEILFGLCSFGMMASALGVLVSVAACLYDERRGGPGIDGFFGGTLLASLVGLVLCSLAGLSF